MICKRAAEFDSILDISEFKKRLDLEFLKIVEQFKLPEQLLREIDKISLFVK